MKQKFSSGVQITNTEIY